MPETSSPAAPPEWHFNEKAWYVRLYAFGQVRVLRPRFEITRGDLKMLVEKAISESSAPLVVARKVRGVAMSAEFITVVMARSPFDSKVECVAQAAGVWKGSDFGPAFAMELDGLIIDHLTGRVPPGSIIKVNDPSTDHGTEH